MTIAGCPMCHRFDGDNYLLTDCEKATFLFFGSFG